jgi:hypothetical protein
MPLVLRVKSISEPYPVRLGGWYTFLPVFPACDGLMLCLRGSESCFISQSPNGKSAIGLEVYTTLDCNHLYRLSGLRSTKDLASCRASHTRGVGKASTFTKQDR